MASQEIEALSQALARLPGLGPRSARRAVLYLMKRRETRARAAARRAAATSPTRSSTARPAATSTPRDPCASAPTRAATTRLLCVVEEVADLWALDRSRLFPGRYHVLGGRLSALEGVRPEDLSIDKLVGRVAAGGIDEVVLAMNATLEGQTTAHYLAERLEGLSDSPHPARPRPAGRRRARLSRRRHARPSLARAAPDCLKPASSLTA